MNENNKISVYGIITEKIIELLEKGIIPWKQTWNIQKPVNIVSKHKYSGINFFLLNSVTKLNNYPHNCRLTFKQVPSLKGKVIEKEKGIPIVFWTMIDKKIVIEVSSKARKAVNFITEQIKE